MEQVNIALDIYSIVICIIMGAYLFWRGISERQNRYFFGFCVSYVLLILGDMTDWICSGVDRPEYSIALQAGQFMYYFILAPTMYFFIQYICTYLSDKVKVSEIYLRIIVVMCIFHGAGAILTPFTGLYYVISENNEYTRGDFVFLASILPVTMYLIVLIMAVRYRKVLQRRIVAALVSYSILPLIGQVIQNMFRGVGALIPAITLAMLLIFINLQQDIEVENEKQKRELLEARSSIMLSQIQPHFLYNVLAIIRRLCDQDPQSARKCIENFSVFLRANMESLTRNLPQPFENELEHTRCYLELEKQRFGDMLSVVYDIRTVDFCIPALTLQPIVENAVRHGIRKNEEGGTVTIRTVEEESRYLVVVEDDGRGFYSVQKQEDSPHIGIENVRMRLTALCRGTIMIESEKGKGTKVTMKIPKGGSE